MLHLYIQSQLASEININILMQPEGEFGTTDETVPSILKLLSCSHLSVQLCIYI